jgi:hypothetical protein
MATMGIISVEDVNTPDSQLLLMSLVMLLVIICGEHQT